MRMSKRKRRRPPLGNERRAVGLGQRREHRIGRVRLCLVGEVEARQLVPEQAAREDEHVERGASPARPAASPATNEKAPSSSRAAAAPARARSPYQISIIPSAIGSPAPSSSRPASSIAPGRPGDELVLGPPAEADRVERPDRLRRRRRSASSVGGVERRRRGRGRCPTCSRAPTRARSSRGRTSRPAARAPSGRGPALKIGSYGNSGSPGKYICVTSRCVNARPKTEKWMCAGRQAFSWLPHGYEPGLTVTKR